jgi:Meiotically up-regulated gene 113
MSKLSDILQRKATIVVRRKVWRTESNRLPDVNLAVYIIGFVDPKITAVKIGVSNNVDRRLEQLQTGCPWDLQVMSLDYRPDAYQIEDYLHKKFRRYRIRPNGEWFDFGVAPQQAAEIIMAVKL